MEKVLKLRGISIRPASTRVETIPACQVEKTLVETRLTLVAGLQHGALLVVYQHLFGDPTKVFKAADQAFTGVFAALAICAPEVETPRVAQQIHNKAHPDGLTGDLGGACALASGRLPARKLEKGL